MEMSSCLARTPSGTWMKMLTSLQCRARRGGQRASNGAWRHQLSAVSSAAGSRHIYEGQCRHMKDLCWPRRKPAKTG